MGLLKKIISWFIPEQKQAKQQTGTNLTKASSDDHIKIIYGTRETKGTIVFMDVTNPNDGDDIKNDLLHIVIVWCEGGIESIDDLLLNGISINDSKFNAKDGGRWAYANHFENGMAGFGTSHLRAAGFDPINKGHRLDALACSYIRLEWTTGEDAPFTGIPDVTAIIKGRKVKNLETGVVEYSENPAYCTLDYLTHPIVSKKLTETEYDLESFKVSGRICDTQVPTYQGSDRSKPLFTCNAIIDTAQSVLENTELLSKSMRALMPIINGKLTLIIEQDDAPTPFGLSEKEFLGTLKYDEGSKNKRYNRVIVEYVDKELKFSEQDAVYPEPESALANQWLAEDNGVLLEYRFKVSSCTDYYEARQMARIIAMLSREALSFDSKVAPIGLRYTVGDVVPISHKKLGWKNKPFRIIDKTDLADGTFNFSFREHQPYIYNWLSGEVRPPIPDTSLPDPRNITAPTNFSSELLNDGHVSIKWESEYSYFDIQIYKDNALILSTSSISNEFVITALDAGNYEMDLRAASKIGFRSAWVSFGFNVELPAEPTVNIDAVTYNTITLSASVAGASLGTTFEWQFLGTTAEPISEPNTAAGYNYIYTGLVPDTEYSFKVRTKNLSGVSPWVDVRAKTSLSDLLDYIDDIPLEKLSPDAQTLIEDMNQQVDRLRPGTENNLPDVLEQTVSDLNLEKRHRKDIEKGVLDLSANYTNWRQEYERRQLGNERLIDAVVYVDPENGLIVNRAFSYTDDAFNEANLLIDGVNAEVTIQANRITQSDTRISQAESELEVQAGQISQRATFTEMQSEIAGAIAALRPAYSWQFNSGDEGFTGVESYNALGFIVAISPITTPEISYNAQQNPMFRIRVRKHADTLWNGKISVNGGAATITVPEPSSLDWHTIQLDTEGTAGYVGNITGLQFDLGQCDIDAIEIGKRGANDLALKDIKTRTTELISDINAAEGIMAQYATTTWVSELGYQTESSVNQILDTFNTTYKVSATLQQFTDNGTLEKANTAQQFIDGADAYIKNQITAFNAAEGGVNAKFTSVESKLDALEGSITNSLEQINGIQEDLTIKAQRIAAAEQSLQVNASDIDSLSLFSLQLETATNDNKSQLQSLNTAFTSEQQASVTRDEQYQAEFESVTVRFSDVTTAIATIDQANTIRDQEFDSFVADTISSFDEVAETFASQNQAYTTLQQNLTSKIDIDTANAKSQAIATAQEYTRTAVGYCLDAQGNITNSNDAVQCVADGGSWVNGPLAEFIANMQISDGANSASIKQLRQVFKTVDGQLVARGGWQLDSNGRAVGVVGYNDGQVGNLDLVGDVIRQGVMVGNTFVPTSYIDNTDPANPVQVFKGRMELGDGYAVNGVEDIRAQDGDPGPRGLKGSDGLNGLGSVNWDLRGIVQEPNNTLRATASGGWTNGAVSTESFDEVEISAQMDLNLMMGFTKTPMASTQSVTYKDLDFAVYRWGNTSQLLTYVLGNRGPDIYLGNTSDSDVVTLRLVKNKSFVVFLNGNEIYRTKGSPLTSGSYHLGLSAGAAGSQFRSVSVRLLGAEGQPAGSINLANHSDYWVIGRRGSQGPFIQNGSDDKNTIIADTGPLGTVESIWYAQAGNNSSDGGWNMNNIPINHEKTYRFSVWMKQEIGRANSLYLGCDDCLTLSGVTNTNPYFWTGDLPQLNKWYLVVGVLHSSKKTSGTISGLSGVYDPATGKRVLVGTDFKSIANRNVQTHRAYRYYVTNQSHTAKFARPRLEVMDGGEPSVFSLLGTLTTTDPGTRGAGRYDMGTATGAWSDTTANNIVPNGVPVTGDVVTIFKASDPKVQTTKRYTGSTWQSYALHIHGSALIEDTLDGNVLRAGTRIESPRIDMIGSNFLKVEFVNGFGPDNLWYWYGPKILVNGLPNLNALTKANATDWKDVYGNSFTRGTFVAGSLETSASTSQLISTPSREIEFTSNGRLIHLAVSYSYSRYVTGPNNGAPNTVYCPSSPIMTPVSGTVYLERWTGSSWVVVQQKNFSGTYDCSNGFYESEPGSPNDPYRATTNSNTSFTATETRNAGYVKYRVRAVVNNFISTTQTGQYLSIAASE